jgi:hypothetical protein
MNHPTLPVVPMPISRTSSSGQWTRTTITRSLALPKFIDWLTSPPHQAFRPCAIWLVHGTLA